VQKLWSRLAALVIPALVMAVSGTVPTVAQAHAFAPQPLSDQQIGEYQLTVDNYRDIFGGVWADPNSHVVTLKIVPSTTATKRQTEAMTKIAEVGTAADPKAQTGPKVWRLRVTSAGPSLATLDALMAKVKTAQPWATDSSHSLVSWYINPKIGKLVIGLDAPTPTLLSEAQSTFGSLAQLTQEQRPVLHVSARLLDSQPYYGSDRVATGGASCTAGFEVYQYVNGGFHYGMLTAGHCWSVGTVVKQGYYDSGGTLHYSGNMGKVTLRSYGNNVVDDEFIDGTATGTRVNDWIWVGSSSSPYALQVHSGGTSVFGLQVCFDGSFTAENCQGDVDATDVCVQFQGGYNECHLDRAFSLNGSTLAGSGDSGGPVVTHDGSSGLVVYGTDTGGNGTTQEYYSDLQFELNALNVGLIVN
jgi:hypothetical protein